MTEKTKVIVTLEARHVRPETDIEIYRFDLKIGGVGSILSARPGDRHKVYCNAFAEWATDLKGRCLPRRKPFVEPPLEYEIRCANGPDGSLAIPDEHFEVILGVMVALFEVETKDLVTGQPATDPISEVIGE